MTKQNDKAFLYICSFVMPVILLLAVFVYEGFAPFGDKSLLIMDMSGQYVEFYNALKYGDVFFSWSKSLGTNYIGVFAYYVSSPFSLLTLFFSDETMPLCMMLMTLLKIGLAGLSFSVYGSRRFEQKDAAMLAFSCAYALMGYNLAYSMCLMWIDGVIWLPLLLLGVERILSDGRFGMFCASLIVSLISNYYISYMIILFTAFYFVARGFEERLGFCIFLRRFLNYVFGGCSAAGIGAFFLLPAFLSHFDGKLANVSMEYGSLFNFAWSDFFRKLLIGGYDSITNSGAPFVFCGCLAALFAFLFFLMPNISWRRKLSGAVLLVFMAISMWLTPLDKVWHVFQYPNWFPYRYSFLFSFVLISLACQAFCSFKPCSIRFVPFVLLVGSSIHLVTNAHAIFRGLDSQFGYESLDQYREFRQKKAAILPRDDGFYRIGSVERTDRTKNDALSFDYNGVTHYSSSYLSSVNTWLKRYGLAQNYFWSSGYGSTPFTDAFLGIKYVVSDTYPAPDYKKVSEGNGMSLYQNPGFSSIAFFAPTGFAQPISSGNVFENQNSFFQCLTGLEGELFRTIPVAGETSEGHTLLCFVADGSPVYCHFTRQSNAALLSVNGMPRCYLFTNETDCIQYLGNFAEGDVVIIELGADTSVYGYEICSFDRGLFAEGLEILQRRSLNLTDFNNFGGITGSVDCDSEGLLITSIPFAGGWRAYVDGGRMEVRAILDTFLAVPLSAGIHEVELRYVPPGLIPGAMITIFTILILAVPCCIRRYAKG